MRVLEACNHLLDRRPAQDRRVDPAVVLLPEAGANLVDECGRRRAGYRFRVGGTGGLGVSGQGEAEQERACDEKGNRSSSSRSPHEKRPPAEYRCGLQTGIPEPRSARSAAR
jgi:hypothetical protein